MKRGTLVTAAASGDYGKPRPAVIVQADYFDHHPSLTLLPITSALRPTPLFRVDVAASITNGLRVASQVMIDKALTLPRERIGSIIGELEPEIMLEVDRRLAIFLGVAA